MNSAYILELSNYKQKLPKKRMNGPEGEVDNQWTCDKRRSPFLRAPHERLTQIRRL